MRSDVTFIGIVRRVVGAKILVELAGDISSSPIIEGRTYRIGQVGSFVRLPVGFLNLYGIVATAGASELPKSEVDTDALAAVPGQRWIEVQIVGEAYQHEEFQRGVSIFPTLDDEVHVVTEEDLSTIYGARSPSMIEIGTLAASVSLPAYIDLNKIVSRHSAIVGSTGSGKSNTVTGLLKAITSGAFPNAGILLFDPHGEYRPALGDRARVFSINGSANQLKVPFWALSFDELAWFLVDRRGASESVADTMLRERVLAAKKLTASTLKSGSIALTDITADSPIPFDLRQVWYDLYEHDHATLRAKDDWGQKAYKLDAEGNELRGSAADVIAPEYEPPGSGASPPHRGRPSPVMSGYLTKIAGRLRDPNYDFLTKVGCYDGVTADLGDLLRDWLAHDHCVTVLDLSGVPSEVTDTVVGAVTRVLFESLFWGRDLPGIGRQRPLLLVYEEAHLYLPHGAGAAQFVAGHATKAVRRVAKEGRKYGLGMLLVSQRPSELDETILCQCGTFLAMRLSSTDDQNRIKAAISDSMSGLIDILPALRTGEAVIVGEGVPIPCRTRFPRIEPRPSSDDPHASARWKEPRAVASTSYDRAATRWRSQRIDESPVPVSSETPDNPTLNA